MVQFPPNYELLAMEEWRERHPFDKWPIDSKATSGADENKRREARALIQAAQENKPFSSVQPYNYTPDQYANYVNYPGTPPSEPFGELNQRIMLLETENQVLRAELEELRPKPNEKWEKEQREGDLYNKIAANQLQLERLNSRLNSGQV